MQYLQDLQSCPRLHDFEEVLAKLKSLQSEKSAISEKALVLHTMEVLGIRFLQYGNGPLLDYFYPWTGACIGVTESSSNTYNEQQLVGIPDHA